MHLSRRAVGALAITGWLALPAGAFAGPLVLTIGNGRVTLSAQDVPLRQILAEWERLGGTRIVNRDRVPQTLVTLELANVPEERAVEMVLRPAAGFMATTRDSQSSGASMYSRIIIMPGAAAPPLAIAGASPQGRGMPPQAGGPVRPQQMQRRVMADGTVVNFIDSPNRPGEGTIVDDSDDPGGDPGAASQQMMRPPFGAPTRPGQQGQPPRGMGGDPNQSDDNYQAAPQAPSATPTVPTRTVATPGLLPVAKPGQPQTPPGPPKPPGD
jgi:hypothetical protein